MKKWILVYVVVIVAIVSIVLSKYQSDKPQSTTGMQDMSGVHIMTDGTIMSPQGTPLRDATILLDGSVKLGDGRIITPMADYRKP